MNTISYKAIRAFIAPYPEAAPALAASYKTAKKAAWRNLAQVKQVYPHADLVGKYTVFNIGGNKYRLITEINYQYQQILIRTVLTHHDYDKWKP